MRDSMTRFPIICLWPKLADLPKATDLSILIAPHGHHDLLLVYLEDWGIKWSRMLRGLYSLIQRSPTSGP